MILRPPRSTPTDTLCPDSTLFRSPLKVVRDSGDLSGALTQDVLPGQPGRFYGQCDAVKTKARPGKQFANSRKARPFSAQIDVGERVRHKFPVDRRSTDQRLKPSRFRRTKESVRASAPVK